jgi:hypothetical protein
VQGPEVEFEDTQEERPDLEPGWEKQPCQPDLQDSKVYFDHSFGTMMRLHPSGALSPATHMRPGARGLQEAVWDDGLVVETEVPNDFEDEVLVLKRPAAHRGIKRPAAVVASDQEGENCEGELEEVEEVEEAPPPKPKPKAAGQTFPSASSKAASSKPASKAASSKAASKAASSKAASKAGCRNAAGAVPADGNISFQAAGLTLRKAEQYSLQSYIRINVPNQTLKPLLISVSHQQSPKHHVLIQKLEAEAGNHTHLPLHALKAHLIQFRLRLLS